MLFFCFVVVAYPQQDAHLKSLEDKIADNRKLFQERPEQALYDIGKLLNEAEKSGQKNSELNLLANRCEYYYFLRVDFEQMINSALELQKKAITYKNLLYEAKSHKYLSQAYSFNELFEKSLEELELGMKVLSRADAKDSLIILEKANFHTAFANIYNLKKEYFSGIQSLLNSVKEHDKLTESDWKNGTKFMDYANLGGAYLMVNLDSAEYYAQKSISFSTEHEANHNLMFLNYIVLGDVFLKRKKYEEALAYYKKAESIQENKHFINIEKLYNNLIEVYGNLNQSELKEQYEQKLKDLRLTVSENQNKSLRTIIRETGKNSKVQEDTKNNQWIWITGGILILGGLIYFFTSRKKESKFSVSLTQEAYNKLIGLLKENDPSFLLAFEEEFPEFSQKLLKINSDLSNAEIELLAMIKLNLSNKEIAQYKFIQHKTVQNRRHKIRKKINLTSDTDLNKWVENF
ncbi:helix-turn-helix transcriptional regulator [Moheibacter sediminis]|nr:LuxR family transcriptional regulator [Moheibacter sediminis]